MILTLLLTGLAVLSLQAVATVKFSVSPDSLKPGQKGMLKAVVTVPANMHQSYFPGDEEYFYLKASAPGVTFGRTVYPEPKEKKEDDEWIYAGSFTLSQPFTVHADVKPGILKINAELGYNICLDTGSCEPPETVNKVLSLKVTGSAPAAVQEQTEAADTAAVVAEKPEGKTAEPVQTDPTASGNLWKYLLMAFLGGIILNIMPCVLPVLSIKAMSIVKQAHEDKSVIMKHSFAYTGGILISFLVLAAVIVILKLAGESVGWGFQFQNTGFVLALVSLIFVFALSLFDVFIINAPGINAATRASGKGGMGGSFFSGIFAVLLATPCSAPMLGTALGFAFAQPPWLIFAFFVLIGLGLALPFILLGFNPKLMKIIPKPGEWMNIFKEVMGFLLLGTAVWLLHVVFQQNGGTYLLKVLIYLIFLGFAVWLYGRFVRYEYRKTTQWIFTLLAILIIVASAWWLLPVKASAATQTDSNYSAESGFEGWLQFSPELVEELVEQGKPVFIDFGAKWCMTCLTNEKTVLTTQEMRTAFEAKNVVLVRGDFTKKNPVMQAFMKKFGRAGVPFYVLYAPGKEPQLFPEVITISMLKKALEQLP
jgi:thiol:disulfide interchange protein DsbD